MKPGGGLNTGWVGGAGGPTIASGFQSLWLCPLLLEAAGGPLSPPVEGGACGRGEA